MAEIDLIETVILDIPTIRVHVLSRATMRVQTAVLVRLVKIGRGRIEGDILCLVRNLRFFKEFMALGREEVPA